MLLTWGPGQEEQSSIFGLDRMNFYWASKTCLCLFPDLGPGCGSKFLPNSGRHPAIVIVLSSFILKIFWPLRAPRRIWWWMGTPLVALELIKRDRDSLVWWQLFPSTGMLRQEDCGLKTSQGYFLTTTFPCGLHESYLHTVVIYTTLWFSVLWRHQALGSRAFCFVGQKGVY